jgi:hypothetical protein
VSRPLGLQELRAALRSAGTGVWEWDIVADQLHDADLGYEQLGYAPGDIPLSQQAWDQLIHPEDLAGQEAAYQAYLRGETPLFECRYRVRAKDGSWHWFEERGQVVQWSADGQPQRMLGTQTDVTLQMSLREAAAVANQRLERLPQHVPGVLFQFRRRPDGSGSFPYVSERSQQVLGLAPEALRADANAVMQLIDRSHWAEMLGSIAVSQQELSLWRLDFSIQRGGEPRALRGTASPEHEPDGSTLWHGYLEDVTELLALERAQRESEAVRAASRAKTAFLSRVSHELRTPLNAVLGFSQLLEVDPLDPPSSGQRRRLQLIRESGQHLLQMIGDLLDLTRAEVGGLTLQIVPLALGPLVQDCVAMLQPAAAAEGVALAVDPAAALHVRADPTRLRQVLLNLVGNAVKYNRPGGWVRLHLQARDGQVAVHVQDNGLGIAAEELPLLFDPFWRSAETQQRRDGAGIGLAIAQSLVQAMGGRIEVQSTLGAGSVFSVWLPAA